MSWPRRPVDADAVGGIVAEEGPLLAEPDRRRLVDELLADLVGLGPLEPLLADPAVTDVMVNGGGAVWIERSGRLERTGLLLEAATVLHLIEKVVGPLGLRVDRSSPLVDARLPDGSRVNAVVPPLAVDGPCLTIRRFGPARCRWPRSARARVAAMLRDAVRDRRNIVVCGGTGSGKTTLLNALAGEIPAGDRIITVEDAAELRLPQATSSASRPARPTPRARARSACATSSATRCACDLTASWSASVAAQKRSTCCKQ